MNNRPLESGPTPRRDETSSQARFEAASLETDLRASRLTLELTGVVARQVFEGESGIPDGKSQFYDDPSYLGDYIDEVASSDDPVTRGEQRDIVVAAWDQTSELVAARRRLDAYLLSLDETTRGMLTLVADFTDARVIKSGNKPDKAGYDPSLPEVGDYKDIAIDPSDEPLVPLSAYSVEGQSYYSRPNGVTGDPVPGVSPDVFVRESLAERLVELNELLRLPASTEFFGGEVEVYVKEGYRDPKIQQMLHGEYIPQLIRTQLATERGVDPDEVPEVDILKIRDEKIATSADQGEGTPGPHQTGAAVDLTIRFKHGTDGTSPGDDVWFGKHSADLVKVNNPDHFEHAPLRNIRDIDAQQNLRALHYLLDKVGLVQNPTEYWHASNGDQLSLAARGTPDGVARYGWPVTNPQTYIPPKN